jgi:hypothetical protein
MVNRILNWPPFFFWIKFFQRYIADMIIVASLACNSQIPHAKWSKGWPTTFCNSTKSYLSPFSKLPQGNGAPHANTRSQEGIACGAPLPFANLLKGLKSLLELLPKVICYSYDCINKSKQSNFLTIIIIIIIIIIMHFLYYSTNQ